ncbi:DnaJ domain-containing protein [bacterium]|nr:DnaJ domain-containing protein [bacterium]
MTKKTSLIYFNLPDTATLKDVQKAFRQKAKELHPDVSDYDTTKDFQNANEHYQFLKNAIENPEQINSFTFSYDDFFHIRKEWEDGDYSSLDQLDEDGYNILGIKIGNPPLEPKTVTKYKANLSTRT